MFAIITAVSWGLVTFNISPKATWSLVALVSFVIFAFIVIWGLFDRDRQIEKINIRHEIREQLGEYLREGQVISELISCTPPLTIKSAEANMIKWVDTVAEYIRINLGISEESLFLGTASLTVKYPLEEEDIEKKTILSHLNLKLQRLEELNSNLRIVKL